MLAELLWSGWMWAALALAPAVLFWVNRRRHRLGLFKRIGVPGPEPDFLWGNFKQLKEDRLKVMGEWIKTYGKVFGLYMADQPYLVISDLDLIRQVFVKEANVFQDRPAILLDVEPLTSSLVSLRGDEWKKVRTVLNSNFTCGKVKLLSEILTKSSDEFLKVFHETHKRGKSFDVLSAAQGFSMNVITKSALAWEVNCQQQSEDSLLTSAKKLFNDLDKMGIESALSLPGVKTVIKWIYPFTEFGRTLKNIADDIRKTMNLRRQGQGPRKSDMLQLMLDTQNEGSNGDSGEFRKSNTLLEDRHIVSNAIVLLMAGFETTAMTIGFAHYLLATHPEEQEKVYQEMKEVLPNAEDPDIEELDKLKRLDMVIRETLRLYPAVPMMVSRVGTKDMTVLGQFIPAGVNVMAPSWHVQRDPALWPEPSKFIPDRFLEEQPDRHPVSFMPFGLGPKMCLGKRLALFELKVSLFKVLTNYKITMSEDAKLPVKAIVPDLLLRPEGPIMLTLQKRDHTS